MADYTSEYIFPPDLIREAESARFNISRSVEHVDHGFLLHRDLSVLRFEDRHGTVVLTASDLVQFLSRLRPLTHDSATQRVTPPVHARMSKALASRAGTTLVRFVSLYFDEIRSLICKRNRRSLGTTTHAALVALARWLTSNMGLEASIATGVAAAILIALLTATKGAFCRMTAKKAMSALEKATT